VTKQYQHIIFVPEKEKMPPSQQLTAPGLGIVNEILEKNPVSNGEITKPCVIYTDGEVDILQQLIKLS
jgi:hypothetical protein